MPLYSVIIFHTLKTEYQAPGKVKTAGVKYYVNSTDPDQAKIDAYAIALERDTNRYENYLITTPQDLTSCNLKNTNADIKILVVGAGGYGGTAYEPGYYASCEFGGGGGGGGEVVYNDNFHVDLSSGSKTYSIIIGNGQIKQKTAASSFFGSIEAKGGISGEGTIPGECTIGLGGASGNGRLGGVTTLFQCRRRNNDVPCNNAAGGAGVGGPGQDTPGIPNPSSGGLGGIGRSYDISGSSVMYGSGGCGGYVLFNNSFVSSPIPLTPGPLAISGSGGGDYSTPPAANRGGGAGVSRTPVGSEGLWNMGADGIVIVRYKSTDLKGCTGGVITTDGLDTIHTFTEDGEFIVPAFLSTS